MQNNLYIFKKNYWYSLSAIVCDAAKPICHILCRKKEEIIKIKYFFENFFVRWLFICYDDDDDDAS